MKRLVYVVVTLMLVLLSAAAQYPLPSPPPVEDFGYLSGIGGTAEQRSRAVSIATAYGIDPIEVLAVVQVESNWVPDAESSEGCMGLMQINPRYHGQLPDSLYFREELNLELGVAYLSWLHEKFAGDQERVWTGYNWGPYHRQTKKWGSSRYARKVAHLVAQWNTERESRARPSEG